MAGDEVGEDEYPAKVSKYGERGFILISTNVSELSSLKVGAGGL
jgi:hypothetical protein